MTADDWIERLRLERHPEGGWFRETYRSTETLPAAGLPPRFGAPHPASTAIYFLLRGGEFSALHRLEADEVWHFYDGVPLTLHLIAPGGTTSSIRMGAGEFQAVVTAGHWFGATLDEVDETAAAARGSAGRFALVGCTVAPGFIFDDFELGDRAALLAQFPQHAGLIMRLTR
jgi:predicted cupin superfamily sugar epimerase